MTRRTLVLLLLVGAACAWAQDEYAGPQPEKPDVPYLLMADKLIATEVYRAEETKVKKDTVYVVPGATSPARTPLPSPVFLLKAEHLEAGQLTLYRFDLVNGNRQIVVGKRRRADQKEYHFNTKKLADGLFRMELSEMLDPGEYSLSPQGDNTTFCFTVY
jgi:hypothetical protein